MFQGQGPGDANPPEIPRLFVTPGTSGARRFWTTRPLRRT